MTSLHTPTPAPGLRQRKRLAAMKAAQARAVELFDTHGFGAVTVEEVAAAAEVSPVSLYRWFGSKEQLVLWDEYDPGLFAAIGERLATLPPLEAVRDALIDELSRIYAAEHSLVLARTRLIHREPALMAATADQLRAMQQALAALFIDARRGQDDEPLSHAVLAGAAVAVLASAVEEWQRRDGDQPLADLISEGFEALRGASWTT